MRHLCLFSSLLRSGITQRTKCKKMKGSFGGVRCCFISSCVTRCVDNPPSFFLFSFLSFRVPIRPYMRKLKRTPLAAFLFYFYLKVTPKKRGLQKVVFKTIHRRRFFFVNEPRPSSFFSFSFYVYKSELH